MQHAREVAWQVCCLFLCFCENHIRKTLQICEMVSPSKLFLVALVAMAPLTVARQQVDYIDDAIADVNAEFMEVGRVAESTYPESDGQIAFGDDQGEFNEEKISVLQKIKNSLKRLKRRRRGGSTVQPSGDATPVDGADAKFYEEDVADPEEEDFEAA